MKKITILCLHLGYGGIEKAISSLANLFCDTYDITIVSTYKLYDKPAFVLDKNIKVEYLICDDLAKRVENYFSTGEREAAEMNGSDFYRNVQQRRQEKKIIKEAEGIADAETTPAPDPDAGQQQTRE